jgi:hypothetical protein
MITGPDEGPQAPVDLDECVEILTCVRRNEIRVYRLRVVTGGAELWRTSQSDAGGIQSVKESDFKSSEQVTGFLEELRRSLIAGGWREG